MKVTKDALPRPYNGDFAGIVTRVKGSRDQTRSALVNSLKVASYIRAGVTIIEDTLGSSASSTPFPAGEPESLASGRRFLTRRAVIGAAERLPPPFLAQRGE